MLKKTDSGWHAEDIIEFDGARKLCVKTYKMTGALISCAAVNTYGNGMCTHAFGLAAGGDYSQYAVIRTPGARGTEKAVREQHERAMAMVPQFLENAKAHYAKYPPFNR